MENELGWSGNRKLFRKEVGKLNVGKVKGWNRINQNGVRQAVKRMLHKRLGRSIMSICIMRIQKNKLQSTCDALMFLK